MKTSQKNVTAKIDWLQIIFYHCSIEELLESLLKIEKQCFLVEKAQIRHKEYDVCYSYGYIRLNFLLVMRRSVIWFLVEMLAVCTKDSLFH
ncbi:hypothetical protein [Pilibacter termitis]|uniref:hypothetical protein n=1 Tax=Pilibacter termitis TaxID=263852 RepID=UPI002E0DC695